MFRAQKVWEFLPSSMGCEVQPPAAALNMGDAAQCHRGNQLVFIISTVGLWESQLWVRDPCRRAKCANSSRVQSILSCANLSIASSTTIYC